MKFISDEILNANMTLWENLLQNNLFATPFQTPEFYQFYNSNDISSAKVYAIEENQALLSLCLVTFQNEKRIKGYFSRRAIIYGGPLIANNEKSKHALNLLISLINLELKHKVIYVETRNFHDYTLYSECFINNGWNYKPHMNVQISLMGKTMDKILSAMKYNRRREIQLSIKEGAITKEAESLYDVTTLFELLNELYNSRVKLPMPDLNFFINLFNSGIGNWITGFSSRSCFGLINCFKY